MAFVADIAVRVPAPMAPAAFVHVYVPIKKIFKQQHPHRNRGGNQKWSSLVLNSFNNAQRSPSKGDPRDDLHNQPKSFNILDSKDNTTFIPFITGNQYRTHENLLYGRKDLVDQKIKESGKTLCLAVAGERQYWTKEGYLQREDLSSIYTKLSKCIQRTYYT